MSVRYGTDTLEIEVLDDGKGCHTGAPGRNEGGHGLIGMRERRAATAGTCALAPDPRVGSP